MGKTVTVTATANVEDWRAGETRQVEDTPRTRALIASGYLRAEPSKRRRKEVEDARDVEAVPEPVSGDTGGATGDA